MVSIKIKFRPSTVEGKEGGLYFQIVQNRVVRQVKTGYHIYANEWDKENECFTTMANIAYNRRKDVAVIMDKVQWEYWKLKHIAETLSERCEPYSADDVITKYRESFSDKVTVFEFAVRQIERLNNLGKTRTAECYKSAISSFKKFCHGTDLYFDMMDSDMMELYESYLRRNGLCRNTTSYYIRNLRSIYNKAVKNGLAEKRPVFENVYTGVDKTVKRAISLKDIRKIKYLDLSGNKALDFVRDIFLFSFYTRGMSFIDIAYLRKKDIGNGYLTYSRKKTGQQLSIKWKDEMQEIVNKYTSAATQYLLPIIETEDGTERRQYLRKMLMINRRLKSLAKKAGLQTPLTMYVARHSWASIARDKHVPTNVISKGMGHDSEATTEIYLSSIQSNKVDGANDMILRDL